MSLKYRAIPTNVISVAVEDVVTVEIANPGRVKAGAANIAMLHIIKTAIC